MTTRGWIQPAKSNTNDDDADFIVKLSHTRHTLYALLYSTLYTLSAHRRYQPTLGLYNIVVFLGCWCLCCFFYLLFIFQLPLFLSREWVSVCLGLVVCLFLVCAAELWLTRYFHSKFTQSSFWQRFFSVVVCLLFCCRLTTSTHQNLSATIHKSKTSVLFARECGECRRVASYK